MLLTFKRKRTKDINYYHPMIPFHKARFCPTCDLIHQERECPKCDGSISVDLWEMMSGKGK